MGVEGLHPKARLQLEEAAEESLYGRGGPLGVVQEGELQSSRLEDELAALLPEDEPEDEEEAQEGHGAAEEGPDGDAGVDRDAGAEGAHHQVDQDADQDQDHALDEGLDGALVGADGDSLDLVYGGHVGLAAVFGVKEGDDAPVGEGKEGAAGRRGLGEARCAVEKSDDLLVLQ